MGGFTMSSVKSLLTELRRRRVFRVAGLYVVGSWIVLQVAALAFQSMDIPDTALRWVWIGAFAGFPLALVFGWRYDVTAEGIVRTPAADESETPDLSLRRTDYLLLAALALVAVTVTLNLLAEIRRSPADSSPDINVPINSIAVLPLANFSGIEEQAYFVAGMHEALIADLARISGLKVISRVSTMQYQDAERSAPDIGAELGVAYLIEGSVLRAGDDVRISVQLIEAAGDRQVWSESYERNLTNVLSLQNNVARDIANQIRVKLTPYEEASLSAAANVDPQAYELYLKGRFHWYRFLETDLALALEYFQQSIDIDPDYALAYVGFADALATPAHVGMMPTTQVFPAARQFVQRALELNPDLAEAHDMRARIAFAYEWDWPGADAGFRRAISLKPGYPDVHVVYSQFLAIMNRPDESLDEAKAGAALDPLNPWYRMELAQRRAWLGDMETAKTELTAIVASQPGLYLAYQSLWDIAAGEGDYAAAVRWAVQYFELLGETGVAELIMQVSTADEYHAMMQLAANEFERNSSRPYVSNVDFARLRMHAGDHDGALDRLDEAYRQHESQLGYVTIEPLFEPLWNTERFRTLKQNINL